MLSNAWWCTTTCLGMVRNYKPENLLSTKTTYMQPLKSVHRLPAGATKSTLDFSYDAVVEARKLGFDMFILPGNCTNFLQPWDQCFGAVKAHYSKLYAAKIMEDQGDKPLCRSEWVGLVDHAMWNACSDSKDLLKNAFKKTGLWPPDREVAKQNTQSLVRVPAAEDTADASGLAALWDAAHLAETEAALEVPRATRQVRANAEGIDRTRRTVRYEYAVTADQWVADKEAELATRRQAEEAKAKRAADRLQKQEEKKRRTEGRQQQGGSAPGTAKQHPWVR